MDILERFMAIDNKCAWPNLTLMPDGAIVATIFGEPCHATWEGHAECWISRDGGRMWTLLSVPAPHEPGSTRHNLAAGLTRDNALLVVCSGMGNRAPHGKTGPIGPTVILPPAVCRSEDGGKTWTRSQSPALGNLIPFGDVVPLPDGRLAFSGYTSRDNDSSNTAWVFFSDDDGRTWGDGVAISEGFNETDLLPIADNGLLAISRTYGHGNHLHLFASKDNGRTWTDRGSISHPKECPGHLCRLNDGPILLTYTVRMRGLLGVFARVSEDEGATWDAPRALWSIEVKESNTNPDGVDGGYPSSVQLDDGTIVTAYYCSRIAAHQRYHMGVVRWRI